MSERKVLNKYYPPDYDPSKIPRAKRPKNRQWNIRTMAPFNMRCNTCGEYIYKGKKFNSRQEVAEGETYLGLKIFRFYIRCPKCVSEISFKTDPESVDYALEAGATRNFEALRTAELMAQKEAKEKEEELENNPMKMLENRTKASQREMDMLEILEDLRELNSKHSKVDLDQVIGKYRLYEDKMRELQEEEDEKFIQSMFGKDGDKTIKRLPDEDSDDGSEPGPSKAKIQRMDHPTDLLTQDAPEGASSNTSSSKQTLKHKVSQKKSISTKSAISMMIKKKPASKTQSSASGSDGNSKTTTETKTKDSEPASKVQSSANISDANSKDTKETVAKNSDLKSVSVEITDQKTTEVVVKEVGTKETENKHPAAMSTVTKESDKGGDGDERPQVSSLSLLGNYSDTDSSEGSY